MTRSHITGQPAFLCMCVLGEVLTNRIGTPLADGGSTWDNIVGSGRRKQKHTLRYPFASQRLSSGVLTVLGRGLQRIGILSILSSMTWALNLEIEITTMYTSTSNSMTFNLVAGIRIISFSRPTRFHRCGGSYGSRPSSDRAL